jgi:thiamine-phosphate pyrophosphorylase
VTGVRALVPPRFWLITDPAFGDDAIVRCVQRVGGAVPPGTFGVQLRDKVRPMTSLRLFASRLRLVTHRVDAALVINGHPRVARDAGADGVHLGGDAGRVEWREGDPEWREGDPEWREGDPGSGRVADARAAFGRRTWVSMPAHSDDDVRRASAEGADAVLVSPIFPTRSSAGPVRAPAKVPRGLAALRTARLAAAPGLLLYALGGIRPETVGECLAAGAHGVAVIRALLASPRPEEVARAIHDAIVRRW